MTQQELADAIGIATAQSISRYERGETEVPAKRLRKIAEATGKPMSFFVQEPDEFNQPPADLGEVATRIAAAAAVLESGGERLVELLDRLEAHLDSLDAQEAAQP